MIAVSGVAATSGDTTVTFRFPDAGGRLAGVRLGQDVRIPGDQLDFHRAGDGWELRIDRPPVHRMEYLLELRHKDGGTETITDPGNPRRVGGAFGDKSVLEFGEYAAPDWVSAGATGAATRTGGFEVPVRSLDGVISVTTWAPADAADDEPLPLLVAHDGPEYDQLAGLTAYLAAGVGGGWLPRLRAALLSPGDRDRWYSANARYARALAGVVLPALDRRLATTVRTGMGASLGALAMLHAHCRYPGAFGGLFLQSGSFFWPEFDSHERRFPYYRRIVRFVTGVHHGGLPAARIPVTLTCGVIEENLADNRLMAGSLATQGYPAQLREVPDMHNYTAWRDAFDPGLTGLLREVVG